MRYVLKIIYVSSIVLFAMFMANGQDTDYPLITVQGTTTIFVAPDEVVLQLTIEKSSDIIQEARQLNESVSKKIIDYLLSRGIDRKYIQTQHFSVRKNYNRRDQKYKDFIAVHNLHVCLQGINYLDEISDHLLSMDISRLGDPEFRYSKLADIKDQARIGAMKNAREKGKMLAGTIDQQIGKAIYISEIYNNSTHNNGAYSTGTDAGSFHSDVGLSFAPGQLKVDATVEVAFELLGVH